MEEKILKFIKKFMLENGVTPTIRDIGRGVGLKSTASVHMYMGRLADKGLIERVKGYTRYRVTEMKYVEF